MRLSLLAEVLLDQSHIITIKYPSVPIPNNLSYANRGRNGLEIFIQLSHPAPEPSEVVAFLSCYQTLFFLSDCFVLDIKCPLGID